MTFFLLARFSFCPPNKPLLAVCPNVAKWGFVSWCLSQVFRWVVTSAWAPISMWDYDDEVGAGQHPPAGQDDSPPSYDFSLSSPPQPSQYSKGNFQQTLPWNWDEEMRRFRVKAKLNQSAPQFSLNCCDGLILEGLSLFALVYPNQTKRSAVRGFCWMFFFQPPHKSIPATPPPTYSWASERERKEELACIVWVTGDDSNINTNIIIFISTKYHCQSRFQYNLNIVSVKWQTITYSEMLLDFYQ